MWVNRVRGLGGSQDLWRAFVSQALSWALQVPACEELIFLLERPVNKTTVSSERCSGEDVEGRVVDGAGDGGALASGPLRGGIRVDPGEREPAPWRLWARPSRPNECKC